MRLGRIFSLQPHPAEYRFGEEMVLHQPINIPSFRLMPLVPGLIGFPSMHSPMPLMPPLFSSAQAVGLRHLQRYGYGV
jgi:hypothetical protein